MMQRQSFHQESGQQVRANQKVVLCQLAPFSKFINPFLRASANPYTEIDKTQRLKDKHRRWHTSWEIEFKEREIKRHTNLDLVERKRVRKGTHEWDSDPQKIRTKWDMNIKVLALDRNFFLELTRKDEEIDTEKKLSS